MAENWYLILELEFDPPVEDESVISGKIDERAKFWSANFNHFKYGAQYRMYHQNLAQIKKDMIGPANIRKQLAEQAAEQERTRIKPYLQCVAREGSITEKQLRALAAKLKVSPRFLQTVADSQKIRIRTETEEDAWSVDALYNHYCHHRPEDMSFRTAESSLFRYLDAEDLYDVLALVSGTEAADLRIMSAGGLKRIIDKCQWDEVSSRCGSKAEWLKLLVQETLSDREKRSVYDDYLKRREFWNYLEYVRTEAEVMGGLSTEALRSIYNAALFALDPGEGLQKPWLPDRIVHAFCAKEHISYIYKDSQVPEIK